MAVRAYRLVGPDPQATHYVCDLETELPNGLAGDTAHTKDTGRDFSRNASGWIEVGDGIDRRLYALFLWLLDQENERRIAASQPALTRTEAWEQVKRKAEVDRRP